MALEIPPESFGGITLPIFESLIFSGIPTQTSNKRVVAENCTPRLGYSFFEAKLFVDNIRIRELKML